MAKPDGGKKMGMLAGSEDGILPGAPISIGSFNAFTWNLLLLCVTSQQTLFMWILWPLRGFLLQPSAEGLGLLLFKWYGPFNIEDQVI
ncbi:hypothetical protein Pyn_23773 [Prunus yedoensis var. nudiflora]|uniref:Uncharacterized protein n=1 Tax=Prunus yedoensis var. nudiflora TaxID=2094558 RepID=A0A314ZQZ7_PRUYE|nr:hypothetical protein Pyn_23773 [Prunus yedoensis var. nudiflora]